MPDSKLKEIKTLSTPTTFSDGVHIACRNDGMVLLQMFNDLPSEAVETHRTMMTRDTAERLVAALQGALEDTKDIVSSEPPEKTDSNPR